VPDLLAVENLSIEFRTRTGVVHALEDVGFTARAGEMVGVVGESGSGKSVTASAVMGLLEPAARVRSGRILLEGEDVLQMPESELQRLRGSRMGMIYQSPRTALNPIRTVGQQLEDVLLAHGVASRRAAAAEHAMALLAQVRIADPRRRLSAYPAELSGGMCQRVMIALALASSPRLLIADEPTTGLDVTTQALITALIRELAEQRGMATVLITHDLALASECCDRIVVMHAGHVVESATTAALFSSPRHPYTQKLIATTPDPDAPLSSLEPIRGNIPDLREALPPCRFSRRCESYVAGECDRAPLRRTVDARGHLVACWRAP
jgi:peptide/nickel transport system ATP-binding protein